MTEELVEMMLGYVWYRMVPLAAGVTEVRIWVQPHMIERSKEFSGSNKARSKHCC